MCRVCWCSEICEARPLHADGHSAILPRLAGYGSLECTGYVGAAGEGGGFSPGLQHVSSEHHELDMSTIAIARQSRGSTSVPVPRDAAMLDDGSVRSSARSASQSSCRDSVAREISRVLQPRSRSSTLLLAMLYVVASALCASLTSLGASYLIAECGYYSAVDVMLATGVIGSAVTALWWMAEHRSLRHAGLPSTGLLGRSERRLAMLIRAGAGCVANASLWLSLSLLTMAVANISLSPLLTLLAAHGWFEQPWRWYDSVMTALCMTGIILVADPASLLPDWGLPAADAALECSHAPRFEPWLQQQRQTSRGGMSWSRVDVFGGAAAAAFSLATATSSLVINTNLRAESTAVVTFWSFACVVGVASPGAWQRQGLFTYGFGYDSPSWTLAGVGFANVGFQWLRARGFQISQDASVSAMLYTEIPFAFALGCAVLRQPARFASMLGAALVMGGACLQAYMKSAEENRRAAGLALATAPLSERATATPSQSAGRTRESPHSDYILLEDDGGIVTPRRIVSGK